MPTTSSLENEKLKRIFMSDVLIAYKFKIGSTLIVYISSLQDSLELDSLLIYFKVLQCKKDFDQPMLNASVKRREQVAKFFIETS